MLVLSLVPQLLEPKEGKFSLYFAFFKKKKAFIEFVTTPVSICANIVSI